MTLHVQAVEQPLLELSDAQIDQVAGGPAFVVGILVGLVIGLPAFAAIAAGEDGGKSEK